MRDVAVAGDAGAAAAPRPRTPRSRLDLDIRLSGRYSDGRNAEHVSIVGATQCGKSTITHALVRKLRNTIIVDVGDKHQYDHLGVVTADPEALARHPVVIWTPELRYVERPAKDGSDPWSRGLQIVREVRRLQGVTFVHDEAQITAPTRPHPLVAEMYVNGAGHGLGVITLSQAFSGVYPRAFDGAVHWFLLRVSNASERGNLRSSLGAGGLDLERLPNHMFYYWRTGMMEAVGPFPSTVLGPRPPR